ncbi:unnamed protein product, partial [Thlaspi arvense]
MFFILSLKPHALIRVILLLSGLELDQWLWIGTILHCFFGSVLVSSSFMSYLLLFLTNISDVRIQLGTLLADIGLINLPKSSEVESKKVVSPRDITIVSPLSILLFSGSIYVHHQSGSVTIDGWLKLAEPAQTAVLFKEFWLTLHSILKDLIQKPEVLSTTKLSSLWPIFL